MNNVTINEEEEIIDFEDCAPVAEAPVAKAAAGAAAGTAAVLSPSEAEAALAAGVAVVKAAPAARARKAKAAPAAAPMAALVQPHSMEAEAYLLSCCLIDGFDGKDTVARCIEGRITKRSFYAPANQIIFGRLADMNARGLPIETATLIEELREAGELDDAGGPAYIMRVSGFIPTVADACYFIEKVRGLHLLREVLAMAARANEICTSGPNVSAENVIGEISQKLAELGEMAAAGGGFLDEIMARRFDFENPLAEPSPRFFINGKPVCTPGNLTNIISQAKTGKSAYVGAKIAAAICAEMEDGGKRDTLGVSASAPWGLVLIHIDTEQSREDHDKFVRRAIRRAGAKKAPEWLWSHGLAGFSAQKLREALHELLRKARREKRGIFAIIIDGTADLVNDVNDPEECNAFVAELHGLAIEHHCPVINVVHENPGASNSGGGKMRGHLGSQLERKAESNLVLKKTEEVTVVFSEKMRRSPILEKDGPRFRWSDEEGMHVTANVEARAAGSAGGRKRQYEFADYVDIVPASLAQGVGFNDLHRRAMEINGIHSQSFSNLLKEAVEKGDVIRDVSNPKRPKYYRGNGAKAHTAPSDGKPAASDDDCNPFGLD